MRGQIPAEFLNHHRFVVGPVAEVHPDNGVACEFFEGRQDVGAFGEGLVLHV